MRPSYQIKLNNCTNNALNPVAVDVFYNTESDACTWKMKAISTLAEFHLNRAAQSKNGPPENKLSRTCRDALEHRAHTSEQRYALFAVGQVRELVDAVLDALLRRGVRDRQVNARCSMDTAESNRKERKHKQCEPYCVQCCPMYCASSL